MKATAFYSRSKRFFFDDREKIAAYVREQDPDEVSHIIRVADDVVNQRFLFDLRWDMEQTQVPVVFDGDIDWLHQPGDDCEWVFAFNRMRFWICLGQAYALTKDEKYAQSFASQLCDWIERVKRTDPLCAKAWRSIEAGLRMEYWTKAMLYFEGSSAITEEVVDAFLFSVNDHAEFLLSVWDTYHLMSNWGVLENHGLFIASMILFESEQTKRYRDEAISRLEKEIRMQVYDDGSQWEQSPMYHNEVTHDYLDVVILSRRNAIDIPPILEEKVHAMCLASLAWQKSDGCEPCNGDSDDIDQRDIITKAAYLFADGKLKAKGYPRFDFDTIWDLGYEASLAYDRLPVIQETDLLKVLGDSGNAYVNSDGMYLHFHCGTLGAGHGHSDALHVDLYANGEDVLVDAGRYTYVPKKERYEFKDCTAHNTTTVDHENFTVCKDSWECSKLTETVNFKAVEKGRYVFLQGGHLGYMDRGVFVNRKVVVLQSDLILLCDEFYAKDDHSYQQYLHFNSSGTVKNNRFSSEKNEVQVVALSQKQVKQKVVPTRLSRHYNELEDNETLVQEVEAEDFCSLFTLLSLNRQGEFQHAEMAKVPVVSNFKSIQFEDSWIESVTITKGTQMYTVVVSHQEWATPTDTFNADGCIGFGKVVVFDRSKGETEIGTRLLC